MKMTIFKSVKEAYTKEDWIIDGTWHEVAKSLTTFICADSKDSVELFNLWEFKSEDAEPGRRAIYQNGQHTQTYDLIPGSIRRCKANAIGAWGLVLDYDGEKTIEEAKTDLDGLTYALYTTFRHSPDKHKFRVVLPFDKILLRDDFALKKDDISACFPFADYASFSESQSFYLHSGPDKSKAIAFYVTGAFLNPDHFLNTAPVEAPVVLERREFTGNPDRYRTDLIKSLATCSGLHYNGPHKYNVLTLVALCKSAGINFDEYDALCYQISDPESGLREARQRRLAWDGYGQSVGVTKQKREDFIASHGGRSYFTMPEAPQKIDVLLRRLQQLKERKNDRQG